MPKVAVKEEVAPCWALLTAMFPNSSTREMVQFSLYVHKWGTNMFVCELAGMSDGDLLWQLQMMPRH